MTLEVADEAEARSLGTNPPHFGVQGETLPTDATAAPMPDVYASKTASRLLGNVSRSTIYKWLTTGRLERIPESRKILITRKSVERLAKRS
jgi:hypothetical protein